MNKTIELQLNADDNFFKSLHAAIIAHGEFGWDTAPETVVDKIIAGTIKTVQDNVKSTNPNHIVNLQLNNENRSKFFNELNENIDLQFNRRVHTTTLERFVDLVTTTINEYADIQLEARKVVINPIVAPEKELQAIVNYIAKTWDGFDKVDGAELLTKIWNDSTNLTRNKFDAYAFNNFFLHLRDLQIPKTEDKKIDSNINLADFPLHLMLATMALSDTVKENWDYEKNVRMILSDIKKDFPGAGSLKPKGWKEFSKDYNDFDGMKELNQDELTSLFKGMDSGTVGSYSFEIRVALPHVMYDDKCQGRKPLETLAGAILGHAYAMSENNNASLMLQELVDFAKKITPEAKELSFDFKTPLNNALKEIIKNQSFSANECPKVFQILGIEPTVKKRLKP